MANEKMEWVEIIEPKTKEHMYANLTTGECVWDPPVGVNVKKTDNKQWWELFDHNTGRFYYYNATSQKTVWHRPQNCDIIPLAKLQTLKQNTEPPNTDDNDLSSTGSRKSKESVATQTPGRSIRHPPPSNIKLNNSTSQSCSGESRGGGGDEGGGSPRTRSHHHHHHHHRHQEGCSRSSGDTRGRRGSQGSWRRNAQSQATVCSHNSERRVCNYKRMAMDSGRSSDSSSVSLCKHQDLQAQLSLVSQQQAPQQAQPQTPAQVKPSLAPSPSTPLLKKRSPSQTKANSFDINISIGGGYSLGQENRSSCRTQRILTGSVSNHGISRSQSFAQKQSAPPEEEEDSMHEKYFMSGRRSADSPVRVMDKDSVLKNMSFSKLSPDYSNIPLTKVNQETSTRHLREPSSDLEESNGLGLTPAGAWGNSLKKHNDNSENPSLDSKRLQLNQLGQSIDNVEKNKNIEAWCSGVQVEPHILTLHHYIMEQAKLSGCYRFGEVPEEGDSLNSDDEDLHAGANMDYESDEFADDEAVSNQDDSSSQEFIPDDPPTPPHTYMNAPRYETPHYSDAADYADALSVVDHNSSLYCNTRVSQHTVRPIQPCGVAPLLETQHTSLKRNRDPPQTQPPLYSPILERSELQTFSSAHSLPNTPTQLSATLQYEQLSRLMMNRGDRKLPSDSDIEKYAQDNLNIHKKGIFRKKYSVRELLSWSKDPIRKPMLVLSDKNLKKEATEIFKMVQIYMGDRKPKQGSTQESVLLDMCNLAHSKAALRDELFIQVCRQTTENPRKESLRRGWELMAICLYFFPPSPKFQTYLEGYMNRHRDPSYDFPEVGKWPIHVQVSHYASVSCKRLQRIGVGGKRPIRKPTQEEIEQARIQIFRPSMFGSTLEEVMSLQKSRFPHYKLPWVQTTLSDEVLRLQGTHTEGIFRVSADVDEVTSLKQQLDRWERPTEYTDAHTPASLLKLWYRELYEPLIPDSMYEDCIQCHDDADRAAAIIENLPHFNKLVLAYLIRFLQIFAQPDVVAVTKMDASNLAMVMAPNCLRCSCQEPRVMYENARKEMAFIRTLILSMDTEFMQGVL